MNMSRENIRQGGLHRLGIEATESWKWHQKVTSIVVGEQLEMDRHEEEIWSVESESGVPWNHRELRHHHHHYHYSEEEKKKKHKKKVQEIYLDPGIQLDTMHGMMIDAGSSGSRMHVYEFAPRVLEGKKDISEAVAGNKLSYPGGNSRWTDRVRPGIATFASKSDDELLPALAEYLSPFIEFAEAVLHTKKGLFPEFPIYLKATAGMRMLTQKDRIRVIKACRKVFANAAYNTFKFEDSFARVIAGEEEAIYAWAGGNFVLGSVLKSSEGSGTVDNPKLTHGTVEMGGASSQIAFYQSDEDIVSNLFKLQIGQGKHWNLYAHSYLYFGINVSWDRMGAYLVTGQNISTNSTLHDFARSAHNPCLPGGSIVDFESTILFQDGKETHIEDSDGKWRSYSTTLKNDRANGNYQECAAVVKKLVNKNHNDWCDFAHSNDCSLNGVYQPPLPQRSKTFGDWLALGNYFKIFDFLQIPQVSNLRALRNATEHLCAMSNKELVAFNNERLQEDEALKMCFRSAFAFELLHSGHGFKMKDRITATDVVNGHKVGWPLGSMLYEINTLPWHYLAKQQVVVHNHSALYICLGLIVICMTIILFLIICHRPNGLKVQSRRRLKGYESIIDDLQVESIPQHNHQ
mmetsp:Transcript_9869/g.14837  ORF Transcript_9869/g.14837 Transcript_9869/m.14837 type:complete len:632 (-) Transcript_9869:78-1973(-)